MRSGIVPWSVVAVVAVLLAIPPVRALAPPAVRVTGDEIVVTFAFPPVTPREDGGVVVPRVGDLPLAADRPGEPLLPMADARIVLPAGTDAGTIAIEDHPRTLPLPARPAWLRDVRPLCGGASDRPETGPDSAIYGADAAWPARPAALLGSGTFRGYRVATLRAWPVQVNPAAGTMLARTTLTVRIRLVPAARAEGSLPPRGRLGDIADLARFTANPETAWSYGATRQDSPRETDRPWLVVCPERLVPAFERLVHHREALGMGANLRTMEEILATEEGPDDAAKLQAAIRRAYEEQGTTFVLLGGDDVDDDGNPLVPVRHCPGYDNMPSDWYFGALDADAWDADGDGTFCEDTEVDWFAEVHVGRATVDTIDEANTWIDKLLRYEAGIPEENRRHLVFMGEKLDDSTYGDDAMEQTAPLIPDEYEIEKLYARPETYNKSAVVHALNRGPNMTNHLGHSGAGGVMSLGRSDVHALVNDWPFFSYSQGCYAGAFDQGVSGNDEAISEHFLLADHAAYGVIMNGRYGWYCVGNPTCLSQELDHEFWDAIFTEGFRTLGEANTDARHDKAGSAQGNHTMAYCFLETNLHGDPATRLDLDRDAISFVSVRVDDGETGNGNGVADPGETIRLVVTLRNDGDETATGIEGKLASADAAVTVHDDQVAWPDLGPGEEAEGQGSGFSATIDGACGGRAGFRLTVRREGGRTDVLVFSIGIGELSEVPVFSDDFETDTGWTVGGKVNDGAFVRGDPHGVVDDFSGVCQPEDDHTPDGTRCFVTGNPFVEPGHDPHEGEVDVGSTYVTSPAFDGTGEGTLVLRFARFVHRTGVTQLNEGYVRVLASNDDGANWTQLERMDVTAPSWEVRELDVSSAVAPTATMRVRFEAHETLRTPGDPLVECLVDDVEVFRWIATCEDRQPAEEDPPNPVGATLLVTREPDAVVLSWQEPPANEAHDRARTYPTWRSDDPSGGFVKVAEPMATSWEDWDAMGDLRYVPLLCWEVSAANDGGDSGETP